MVQTGLTVCSDCSAAFQVVRSTTAGGKPALQTVTLEWPFLNLTYDQNLSLRSCQRCADGIEGFRKYLHTVWRKAQVDDQGTHEPRESGSLRLLAGRPSLAR